MVLKEACDIDINGRRNNTRDTVIDFISGVVGGILKVLTPVIDIFFRV